MSFIAENEKNFTMRESPYGVITAKYSITDYYGYNAEQRGLTINDFEDFCKKIEGIDKDIYNSELWLIK
jgi:hypothetical protein